MRSIHELAEIFSEFPGVGPRQARRLVQFLLTQGKAYRKKLADGITKVEEIGQCVACLRYDDVGKSNLCSICADQNRDHKTLVVVEKDVDIEGIERSDTYRGRYFVLGSLIPLGRQRKNGNGARVQELVSLVKKLEGHGLQEIIFALSTTPEGDYTARELSKEMRSVFPNLRTTLLGRGLSVGAEIEYADSETLRSALKNRS